MGNKKGQIGAIVVIVMLVILAIWAYYSIKDALTDVKVSMNFDNSKISSGHSTKLRVTIENNRDEPLEAIVTVKPETGSEGYVSITTNENTNIKLGSKGSSQTLTFIVTGTAGVTVEPKIDAIVTSKNGKSVSQQATLRIEV